MNKVQNNSIETLVGEVRNLLTQARQATARTINTAMVTTYWMIGQRIVVEEQNGADRADYGAYILKRLSKELTPEFGNGFSYANLKNMRQFYKTYANDEKGYTLCSQLGWSHNRLIMRVENEEARHYYLKEAIEEQWSVRALERNIQSQYYQRMLAAPTENHPQATDNAHTRPIDVKSFVKDPYVLEFVGLPPYPNHKENQVEEALADNMQQFLLELGKGFSFVGRQYRISTETSHFYIDLVFYNYILKCFVLIDLKAKKLSHRDIGQMDMYVRMFDDLKRGEGDNPTIGILLCAEKEETVVKYSVLNGSQQLFAAKYLPYMPTEEELRNMIENNVRLLESGKEDDQ
ncbi:MAG: DUF1016 family protein [Bacteroidales bacterium]|nr:DUF1016 family protein [Bacteroidales bacterium]